MDLAIGGGLGLILIVVGARVDRMATMQPAIAAWWYGTWMVVCVALSAWNFATGDYGWGAWMAVCAVINGWTWWKHNKRRKRKRTMAMLGAKSRALIARLVHRQREATAPTP